MNNVYKFIVLAIVLLSMAVVYGRILFWIEKYKKLNSLVRRLMNIIPWTFDEIRASLIGMVYYFVPLVFTLSLCIFFKFNLLKFFTIKLEFVPYILITIIGQLGVISMLSGSLTLVSSKVNWASEIGNISWISSIKSRNKLVAPFVPILGAFFEEVFFRGVVFLLVYNVFPEFGIIPPLILSILLFSLQQILFTENKNQAISMAFGSFGVATVACISIAYTASILPCVLAHQLFLVFYFGRFKMI